MPYVSCCCKRLSASHSHSLLMLWPQTFYASFPILLPTQPAIGKLAHVSDDNLMLMVTLVVMMVMRVRMGMVIIFLKSIEEWKRSWCERERERKREREREREREKTILSMYSEFSNNILKRTYYKTERILNKTITSTVNTAQLPSIKRFKCLRNKV